MLKSIQSLSSNFKIRTKMILLISGVVLISVLPLSTIVLYRNQAVVLDKTFEVCRNLAYNIANLATEELLINETYDATRTALARLSSSEITGLLNTTVLNIDGRYVADMKEELVDEEIDKEELDRYFVLEDLTLKELKVDDRKILKFIYPIFIEYQGSKMRVGTAVFDFDREKVYEPVVKIRETIIIVSTVLFFIGIMIAVLAAFSFSKPIQILSEGAKLIGDGDLNYRIPIHGKDEIGQLARSFNHMTHRIQDFTNNLESMVAQRTDELNQTLSEVQALKEAQDGDYYLTSLLLEPLQFNNNTSKFISTDFYVEQKKKFKFRKWNSQIGGDICITDSIKLNGKEFTVFMNGDAMGKSIQGAGGALVVGVVFNSGIMRTRIEKNSKVHPEIWLKERFLDLQNVFITFEGSMYISVCMGLVDNETGLLYYINAEHPWTVLYRDGKASFLEESLMLRKLGTPGQDERFFVKVFQMMPGDVILAGSDGRDDILLPTPDGEKIMNEDENEYLQRVEDGNGDLTRIVQGIKSKGELADDISILRIGYKEGLEEENSGTPSYEIERAIQESEELLSKGKETEALEKVESFLEENQTYPDLLKVMGRIYFNTKDYSKSIECFLSYIDLNPGDNEYLYVISNLFRTMGQFNDAADYGERLYLRDQNHFLNLINLSEIYSSLGIDSRSQFMADRAISIDGKAKDILKKSPTEDKINSIIEYEKDVERKENPTLKIQSPLGNEELNSNSKEDESDLGIDNLLKRADSHYQAKQYREAMELYLECERYNNNNPWVLFRLGNCYSLLNDLTSALDYYNQSLKLSPKNHHAQNNLGSIHYRLKDYKKAKEAWIQALDLKPDFQKAQINLNRLEKYEQNHISKSLKVNPT